MFEEYYVIGYNVVLRVKDKIRICHKIAAVTKSLTDARKFYSYFDGKYSNCYLYIHIERCYSKRYDERRRSATYQKEFDAFVKNSD